MLIRFSFENFRSFKTRQELTLVASSLRDQADSLIGLGDSEHSLLPAAGIYGANASGKTNVIRALLFLSSAVENSQRRWEPEAPIPRWPFLLDAESQRAPSFFEVEFALAQARYRYGFVLDSERVLEEWLYAYPSGKQQTWFTRAEIPERRFTFSRNLSGENRVIEALTRKNSLYLSAAAQNNHEMLSPVYNYLAKDTRFELGREGTPEATLAMCEDEKHKDMLLKFLVQADLGIIGLRLERVEPDEPFKKFVSALKEMVPQADLSGAERVTRAFFRHRSKAGSTVELDMHDESAGTIAYFSLLGPAVEAIESGGVLCVDELDSSLHPLLALDLLRLFNDRERNPRGAQLIFNTHDTNLLSASVLRRDQIWFTEKDSEGATHLYPLSDFKPRKNENLERGYLQGRYGAIPFLEPELVRSVEEK